LREYGRQLRMKHYDRVLSASYNLWLNNIAKLFLKWNHGVFNYASLNFGCAYCSDCLRENLKEVPVPEIYRRRSNAIQYETSSNTGFKLHFYRIKSYKVTYHLKKKVGETYGGPIQLLSL
jgi:hypothetical protein